VLSTLETQVHLGTYYHIRPDKKQISSFMNLCMPFLNLHFSDSEEAKKKDQKNKHRKKQSAPLCAWLTGLKHNRNRSAIDPAEASHVVIIDQQPPELLARRNNSSLLLVSAHPCGRYSAAKSLEELSVAEARTTLHRARDESGAVIGWIDEMAVGFVSRSLAHH
jgi:hypothetical protein